MDSSRYNRGATIQLFFICLKLAAIDNQYESVKVLSSGEDRFKFIIEHINKCDLSMAHNNIFQDELYRNIEYLNKFVNAFSANDQNYISVSYHSDGYNMEMNLQKSDKSLLPLLNRPVVNRANIRGNKAEITFAFVNYRLATFSFYKYDLMQKNIVILM